MTTGYIGTFAIPLSQSELDGVRVASLSEMVVGAQWRWWGEATRLDGPATVLKLDGGAAAETLRRRAARAARRILARDATVGRWWSDRDADVHQSVEQIGSDQSFVVTDGMSHHRITVITTGSAAPLLVFNGVSPPSDRDMFVTEVSLRPQEKVRPSGDGLGSGLICFAAGTLIATPDGLRPVNEIQPGDLVSTLDDGAQEVLWTGARRMTGARMHAMPHFRPLRIRSGALGGGRPEPDLIVSPEHRILIRGVEARNLFNEDEVLVRACDLLDGRNVTVENGLPEVTYCHLLFERHQIIRANGVETESFHPASADLGLIDEPQREVLTAIRPEISDDPMAYGSFARRSLMHSEAALMRYEAA